MAQAQAMELLRAGVQFANSGNAQLARDHIRKSLQIDPSYELAWLWLAGVSDAPHEALDAVQRTLALNPRNESALQRLNPARLRAGIASVQAGQREQGAKLLRDAASAEPKNEVAWIWLASATDSPQEAFDALKKVLEINPANEQARNGLEYYRSKFPAPAPTAKPAAKPVWQCPFCLFAAEAKHSTCPSCGAMLVLTSIDAFLANRSVQEAKLKPGLERLAARARAKPDFSFHYYLALGFLQLRRIDESIAHFQTALKLQNHDVVRWHLAALEQHRRDSEPAKPATPAPPSPAVKPARKTILIVDDSITVRKLVSMTVNEMGYRVVEAADGQEALECIRAEGVPDLVFLDIMMPGMDGYALCKELRSAKPTANLPIVMLSGKDGMFNKMRGRMAGSTHYLTKPFQAEALKQVIRQYCETESAEITPA
jgi:twitching motility two-component system response regulator PilG